MSLSIVDIAKGISWTDMGHFYLSLKDDKYELLVDYLNASTIKSLEQDINSLNAFQQVLKTKDKQKIEDYIMDELEGFNDWENGYSAYIAGAHDKSASIQYNIENDIISLIHPNIISIKKFVIQPNELINLASQMIQILTLKKSLEFGKD